MLTISCEIRTSSGESCRSKKKLAFEHKANIVETSGALPKFVGNSRKITTGSPTILLDIIINDYPSS